jgi:hypothetical protein
VQGEHGLDHGGAALRAAAQFRGGGITVRVRVAHNRIFDNTIGTWLSKAVRATGLKTNYFANSVIWVSANH